MPFKKKKRAVVFDQSIAEEVNSANVDIKKAYIQQLLSQKKLPIVLLDPLWHSARESIQSTVIKQEEVKLQQLLEERARINLDYKEYGVVKQNFLEEVLTVSAKVQDSPEDVTALDRLDQLHEGILSANDKLAEIEERLDSIDDEIDILNRDIIGEMVAVGYEYIDICKGRVTALDQEIEGLRDEMLKKTNERKASEQLIKNVYNYLHGVVGRDKIEVIDRNLGVRK